eukprot:scaffold28_cov515-Prasinococcus_capsulatus_cf.AAC.14
MDSKILHCDLSLAKAILRFGLPPGRYRWPARHASALQEPRWPRKAPNLVPKGCPEGPSRRLGGAAPGPGAGQLELADVDASIALGAPVQPCGGPRRPFGPCGGRLKALLGPRRPTRRPAPGLLAGQRWAGLHQNHRQSGLVRTPPDDA